MRISFIRFLCSGNSAPGNRAGTTHRCKVKELLNCKNILL
ncbi:Uncharacterized protein dnm_034580 [Desulfonema magnum]|uniref:Uncharacterized protein n=1 Tax=Desulfonema magnum TaxID=45655 RepID=A0A975BL41_9BACT|nr:Uncharacterized protein dnm_034580 [Desulfonema magnum]